MSKSSILATVAMLAMACPSLAHAAEAAGTWLTEDGRGRVRTEHCGPGKANLCGYVVWMKEPNGADGHPKLDAENPEASRKSRQILGHELMVGLKPTGEDDKYEGKVYNADNGKSYSVTIWSEEVGELSVKGCLISYLCKTQTWKRVADDLPGQLKGAVDAPGGPRSDHGGK